MEIAYGHVSEFWLVSLDFHILDSHIVEEIARGYGFATCP